MNETVHVRGHVDDLMDKYYELSFTQNIDDIKEYAKAWRDLAREFDKEGRCFMAAMCFIRAEFYGDQPLGSYVRLIDGSFSDLIPADPQQ